MGNPTDSLGTEKLCLLSIMLQICLESHFQSGAQWFNATCVLMKQSRRSDDSALLKHAHSTVRVLYKQCVVLHRNEHFN